MKREDWPVPMTNGAYEAIEACLVICSIILVGVFLAFCWYAYQRIGMVYVYSWLLLIAYIVFSVINLFFFDN